MMPGLKKSRKGGVLLPGPKNVVAAPVITFDLGQLDDRQYRGYLMSLEERQGGKTKPLVGRIDDVTAVYRGGSGRPRLVTRRVRNVRGTLTVDYACGCRDFLKNLRSGCQDTFCEQLLRGEVTTYGEPRPREPRRSAQRRSARKRWGANGKAVRSNQRIARVDMPLRVPHLIDGLRRREDRELRARQERENVVGIRLPGGQMTTDSPRAAALLLKISNGVSADAMVDRYRVYIARNVLALDKPPHQNTLTDWMNDAALEPVLMRMFHQSTLPFRAMETVGIVDSTKLSDAETTHYKGVQYLGDDRPDARWLKCHLVSALESNAVLAFEFSVGDSHESLYYEKLVTAAMRTFPLKYILADRAYLSERIVGWSNEEYGITAVIPVKKRWNEATKSRYHEVCAALVEWYDDRRRSFDEMYRFRSKIEAVFSVIKRMFHGYNWSKGRPNAAGGDREFSQAWRNETICKLIAYNLRCAVIQETNTGFEADFLLHDRFFPAIPVEHVRCKSPRSSKTDSM